MTTRGSQRRITSGWHADADASPGAATLHEVVSGVFAWLQPDGTWWINNAGAVTGADGTIVVDTCATEERTRRFLDAVRDATSDAPIRFAVNTHQHGDHTYGNSLLPSSTLLIGHEEMRRGLLDDPVIDGCPPVWQPVPDWGDVTRRAPAITVRSEMDVHSGDRLVQLRHPGTAAHTAGDLVAWLPSERVLFSGDLIFHGLTPLVFMGSLDGALRSLDWMASMNPTYVVPGHGPLVTEDRLGDVLADHEGYYEMVRRTAASGLRDELTPLEAAERCDLAEFAAWPDSERLVLNVHRAYADADGRALDLLAALADAVTFNGGPMRTHVCAL